MPILTTGAGCYLAIGGGGGGRTCTSGTNASNFIARTSGLSNADQDAYCVLINGLDTDGIFSKGDVLQVYAAADATTASLNLLSTSFTASLSGSPTLTAYAGYSKSGSTSKVNTGYNASTNGTHFTQNENAAFVYTLDSWGSGTDSGSVAGYSTNTSLAFFMYPHFTDNNIYIAPQKASAQSTSYTANTHFIGYTTSNGSNATNFYLNGTQASKLYLGADALVNDTFNILGDNAAGYRVYNGTVAAFWAGGVLTPTEASNLYSRLATYMTTVHGSS